MLLAVYAGFGTPQLYDTLFVPISPGYDLVGSSRLISLLKSFRSILDFWTSTTSVSVGEAGCGVCLHSGAWMARLRPGNGFAVLVGG